MRWWEILLIIRGYRRRNVLQYQLQRMQVFASTFAYGGNKENKRAEDLWPLYFDRYKQYADSEPISEEEKNEIQEEMAALNAQADREVVGR